MVKTVEETIVELTQTLIEDWGLDDLEISRQTSLKGDMGFEPSDTMQLFAMVQEQYPGIAFRFQDLVIRDGKFIDDINIGQIVAFVVQALSAAAGKAGVGT